MFISDEKTVEETVRCYKMQTKSEVSSGLRRQKAGVSLNMSAKDKEDRAAVQAEGSREDQRLGHNPRAIQEGKHELQQLNSGASSSCTVSLTDNTDGGQFFNPPSSLVKPCPDSCVYGISRQARGGYGVEWSSLGPLIP